MSIITMTAASVPLVVFMWYIERVMLLLGQDASVAYWGGMYARWMIPGIFPYVWSRVRSSNHLFLWSLLASILSLCTGNISPIANARARSLSHGNGHNPTHPQCNFELHTDFWDWLLLGGTRVYRCSYLYIARQNSYCCSLGCHGKILWTT
jgi:hypothetical protein